MPRLFHFTSGNAMFIRISMGSVAVWEILVSGVLLAGSCVVTGILAAKLFRFGTLHYGNPLENQKCAEKTEARMRYNNQYSGILFDDWEE